MTTTRPATTNLLRDPAARRLPWDVMGADLTDQDFTSVDAALESAGLDYEVEVRSLYGADHAGQPMLAPHLRTIVRPMPDGSETVLAAVGQRYTPIQNRDAFAVADLLRAEFGARIAGAADFRSGGASLLVLDLPNPITLDLPEGGTDTVSLDLLIKNAHDGSAALTFALVGMRLACTNALHAALAGASRTWKISHTPNAQARVDLARQSIIAAMNYGDALQAKAQEMVDQRMVDAEFAKIVANLWPVADDKRETRAGQRTLAIRDEVQAIYQSSSTLEGIRGTRWGGYNAVTEWLDWGRQVKGDESAQAASRAEGSLEGPYVRTKAKVWDVFAGAGR